jgi:hypothetical protein
MSEEQYKSTIEAQDRVLQFKKKEIRELKAQLKEAEEVIDFYDPESGNWTKGKQDGKLGITARDRVMLNSTNYGGKRAREYRTKYPKALEQAGEE